jgi:phosphoglycolate phosphatase-like HAD superfamily hydrolase
MRLVLFDIDGTLLKTDGIGRTSTRQALERVYGTWGEMEKFYPGGRTIEAIVFDTLLDAGLHPEIIQAGRELFFAEYIAAFSCKLSEGGSEIQPCPGGPELIESLKPRREILLGLLTGNHCKTAAMKLKGAGYTLEDFEIGAYGDESRDRSHLVALARDRANEIANKEYSPQEIIVIGDTVRDVQGAKDFGARSIAVATGTDDMDMLNAAVPDYLFQDFKDTSAVLNAILNDESINRRLNI